MTPEVYARLVADLKVSEGFKLNPYDDETSFPPILVRTTLGGALARVDSNLVIADDWRVVDSKTRGKPLYAVRNREGQLVASPGDLTIGIGWNLTANGFPESVRQKLGEIGLGPGLNLTKTGIPAAAAYHLLSVGIRAAEQAALRIFPQLETYTVARQAALIELAYNLGMKGLLDFKNTIRAIRAGNWDDAATRLLQSLWARQVKKTRADRIAGQLRNG